MIEITEQPLRPEETINRARGRSSGAVVAFVGSVRDISNQGKRVRWLDLDLQSQELARRELTRIADEIMAKWSVERVAITHRLGRLKVGEMATVFAIGAPHRREAFEACEYALDRFKEVVPAWEKEVLED